MKKHKILLLTIDSVFGALFLDEVLKSDLIELSGIIYSTRIYKKSSSILSSLKLRSITGSKYFSYLLRTSSDLSKLYYPIINQTKKKIRKSKIPVFHAHDINKEPFIKMIKNNNPDIILSMYFNQKIKKSVIELPYDILNIHPGILPGYAGIEPMMRAVLKDEDFYGITLHKVNEELDKGEILIQEKYKLNKEKSLLDLNREATQLSFNIFQKYLTQGKDNITQTNMNGNYYSWPSKEEVAIYLKNHNLF